MTGFYVNLYGDSNPVRDNDWSNIASRNLLNNSSSIGHICCTRLYLLHVMSLSLFRYLRLTDIVVKNVLT